jgi:hypothetical protein
VLVLVWLVVLVMILVVIGAVFVSVAVAGKTPDQKAKARYDQNPANDVALLGLDLFLELKSDQRDHPAQHDRSKDVTPGSKRRHPGQAGQAPTLRARDDGQRDPVIGKDGVDGADDRSPDDEQENTREMHRLLET